jgi:peptide/nickel transport system substrate-binding protein
MITACAIRLGMLALVLGAIGSGPAMAQLAPPVTTQSLPLQFSQAPMLAEQVAAGKLPPVRERLPERPAIVTPVERIGEYGGTIRKMAANVNDIQLNYRLGYEPLVRWGRDGKTVEPGVAESWEMRDDGRTFVFHLRKGMKWSDGAPFTSADFKFTFDNVLSYSGFNMLALPWIRANNQLPKIQTPDPYTVIYTFQVPYGNFLKGVASSGLQHDLFGPKHYLEQFHEKYVAKDKMSQMVREAGFVTWTDYFMEKIDLHRNPDLPTVAAWKLEVPPPASRCLAVRNPYYWKVDPAGNQLPYIDQMSIDMVFDRTILNLKVSRGEADFQMRNIDASNFTLFKEQGREVGYRTLHTPSTNPICIYTNLYSRNKKLRPILQDPRFRKALSHAINRQELIELIYSGVATSSSAITMPTDPYYLPGLDTANIEYDPALANRLLDEVGLKRRKSDGMRTFPDGTPFSQVLQVYPSEEGTNADLWQLVVDYWREVGLQFAPKLNDQTLGFLQVVSGNSDFFCYASTTLHWDVDAVWKVPVSKMSYMAPLYGNYYETDGKQGVKPPPEIEQMIGWYEGLRATPVEAERLELGHRILKQWADQCYVIGICQSPVLAVVSNRLRNVPEVINYDYRLKSPGYVNVEQFFIDEDMAGPAQ